jgi:hypothetical protein
MGQTRTDGSARTVRTTENVEAVWVAITRSPQRSARRHSVALGLSIWTVWRILHDDFHLHPYKMQIVQALNPRDYPNALIFVSTCYSCLKTTHSSSLIYG